MNTHSSRLSGHHGLTLIELLVTLAILAVAGALVSGSFATGLRAWQSGMRSGRSQLVARVVLERMASQLRSAVRSPVKRNGEEAVAFDAGEGVLRFVTLPGGEEGPRQVAYSIRSGSDGPGLLYREFPWPDKDFFGSGRPRREELVPEVVELSVEAVKAVDEKESESGATGDWSPLDKKMPATVKIEIAVRGVDGAEPRRYRVSVPIMSRGEP